VLRNGKDPSAKYFALSVALHVMVVRDKASLPVIDKRKKTCTGYGRARKSSSSKQELYAIKVLNGVAYS